MADGYARVTGGPASAPDHGSGLTIAATPVASAYHDSHPLLVLSSATAGGHGRGHGTLHDLPDQRALMATITAEHRAPDPAELPEAFAPAFEIFGSHAAPGACRYPDRRARAARAGLGAPAGARRPAARRSRRWRAQPTCSPAAERPFLLLGGGAVERGREAARSPSALGAPVGLTVNAKGVVARRPPALGRHDADAASPSSARSRTPTAC